LVWNILKPWCQRRRKPSIQSPEALSGDFNIAENKGVLYNIHSRNDTEMDFSNRH
jgi:hypothetical protein